MLGRHWKYCEYFFLEFEEWRLANVEVLLYKYFMSTENDRVASDSRENSGVVRPTTRAALLARIHQNIDGIAGECMLQITQLTHAPIEDLQCDLRASLDEAVQCLHQDVDRAFTEVPSHVELTPAILPGAKSINEAEFRERSRRADCASMRELILQPSSYNKSVVPEELAEVVTESVLEEIVDIADRLKNYVHIDRRCAILITALRAHREKPMILAEMITQTGYQKKDVRNALHKLSKNFPIASQEDPSFPWVLLGDDRIGVQLLHERELQKS